jgi:hypothetical protein
MVYKVNMVAFLIMYAMQFSMMSSMGLQNPHADYI